MKLAKTKRLFTKKNILKIVYYYYYNGLILPLYSVLCFFKRDFHSVSRGSQDISVLLSLLEYLFIYFSIYSYIFTIFVMVKVKEFYLIRQKKHV